MGLKGVLINSTAMAPPRIIVYGGPGTGKTTFAAKAGATIVDWEGGAGSFHNRTPYLDKWTVGRDLLAEEAEHPTVDGPIAVDTADWMLQRIAEFVCIDLDKKTPADITNTIGSSHGGYFKAREIIANIVYRDLLPKFNKFVDHGNPVILLAHAANVKMKTPEGYDIQTAAPDLPEWILPTFVEWADAILFATVEGGEHVLITQGSNLITAKNRYHLPPRIPMDWGALVASIK